MALLTRLGMASPFRSPVTRNHPTRGRTCLRITPSARHDGVAEIGLALALISQWQHRVGDDARQTSGVEQTLVEVEFPGTGLFCQQAALQPIGEPRNGSAAM